MRQSDRIAPVRLFRHRLTAGVAIGALLPTLLAPMIISRPAHAVVDPVTVAAVAQTASTALSFMNQGPDLTLEVVQQNHRLLVDVHKRLDGIEAAMGSLLEEMANLPGVTRKIVQEELDVKSSNELINSLRTLTTHLEDDGRITGCPGEVAANSAPECLDERQLVHAGLDRVRAGFEGLTNRDPVVNAVALSLAPYYELAYKEALGATAAQLEEVRQEHRAVLRRILDPDNPNGLPAVIVHYEEYRAHRLRIALAALAIDELPPLGRAVPWFKMRVFGIGRGRGYKYRLAREECYWRRVAVEDFGHGVSGLAVKPLPPERVNLKCETDDSTPIVRRGRVEVFVKDRHTDHQLLVDTGDVAVFNGASRALVALKELEFVVQTALAGLDSYDPLQAVRLIRARTDASAALDAVNELRDRDRQGEADRLIGAMRARREAAHASIDLAQQRIQAVIRDLRAREPVHQVILGLQVLAFGMRVYTAVDKYLASIDAANEPVPRGEAALNGAETAALKQAAPIAAPSGPTTDPSNSPTRTSAAASTSEAPKMPGEVSAAMLSDREKMYRATAIVERLRSDPHRDNPAPHELGFDEIAAIEMISLIAGMPETTADKLADTLRAKHDDIASDLITGFFEDFWSDDDPTGIGLPPPLKAFFTASRPNVTAPGGVLDREARLLVTEQLIDEFWHRMEVRYRRDFPSDTVSLPPAPPTGPVLRPVRP